MRLSLATRFTGTIVGVVALATVTSWVSLVAAMRIERIMQSMITENLPSVRTAHELQKSLQEQRGLVSSYILDSGARDWVERLRLRKSAFVRQLEEAEATAHMPEEFEILSRVRQAYAEYDARRDQVLAFHDAGEVRRATSILLQEIPDLYEGVFGTCQAFIAANERYIDSAHASGKRRLENLANLVTGTVVVSLAMGALLLLFLFRRVLLPLRRLAVEAREVAGDTVGTGTDSPRDELQQLGQYMRSIMFDVRETRDDLERSRRELVAAAKLASVGKLAASVTHEIRNPLTSIQMRLFALRRAIPVDPLLDARFQQLSDELVRLDRMIRNFLEFARPPELDLQRVHVHHVIESTLELLGEQLHVNKIHVRMDPNGALPQVMADAAQLRQVFLNLIGNSIEAMKEGGEIHIVMLQEDGPTGERDVVVRIQDTGCGIDEDVRERIFEPFVSTKKNGTGLGLCIAARIVARHGGRLSLESWQQGRTRIAVRLPTREVGCS